MQEASTPSIATFIAEASTNIGEAMEATWTLMTANPLLTLFLGAGIITLGFSFFRKAKRAVR